MPLPVMRMLANLALDGFVGAAPRWLTPST
jgi:hypothetical protein